MLPCAFRAVHKFRRDTAFSTRDLLPTPSLAHHVTLSHSLFPRPLARHAIFCRCSLSPAYFVFTPHFGFRRPRSARAFLELPASLHSSHVTKFTNGSLRCSVFCFSLTPESCVRLAGKKIQSTRGVQLFCAVSTRGVSYTLTTQPHKHTTCST